MSESPDTPIRPRSKKTRKNGKGTTYFDKRRNLWISEIFDLNGKRRRESFQTEDQANEWRIHNVSAREKGELTHAINPKQTLAEYLEKWLDYRKPKIRHSTHRFYDIAIRTKIVPWLGKEKAAKLTPDRIEWAVSQLQAKGLSAGSIRSFYVTLSKAYSDGVRLGWVPSNPMKRIERVSLESKPSPAIAKEHARKLFETAKANPSDLARLIVGITIGLRPGEVAGLRWEDFDVENSTLTISRQVIYKKGEGLVYGPPKTLRKHPIPLLDDEVIVLLNHLKFQSADRVIWASRDPNSHQAWKGDSQIIFPNRYGNLQNPKSDTKWFHELCCRASVPKYQRYQMRKRAFTDLLLAANVASTMAYSGHTQSSTLLKHYITPEDSDLREALKERKKLTKYSKEENQ